MIEGAELSIYLKNGETIGFDLSPVQLYGIVKLLGLDYDSQNNSMSMMSDDSLQEFIEKTIGRYVPQN